MDELFEPPAQRPGRPTPQGAAAAAGFSAQVAHQVTGVATRLRLAEERYANLQKRNRLTEETLLQFERDLTAELRATLQQVGDLRRQVSEINQKVDAIQGELGGFVRKHEFAVVARYLDLWEPLRFVTRDDARRMISEALRGDKRA